MSFFEEIMSPERYWPMHQYKSHNLSGNSGIVDNFAIAKKFQIADIRAHFSAAIASVLDLQIYISSILGSQYNTKLISQALNGVQDIFIHFSSPLQFNSGDTVKFSSPTVSVANKCGIEVFGWAVVG
jgi:hypothetical protein